MRKLKQKLTVAMPDARSLVDWTRLEQLPYLSAVIQATRLPRIADEALEYKNLTIPPATPVSQMPYFVLVDPSIFPEPEAFQADRWLQYRQRPDNHQVSFNKGSGACIEIKYVTVLKLCVPFLLKTLQINSLTSSSPAWHTSKCI